MQIAFLSKSVRDVLAGGTAADHLIRLLLSIHLFSLCNTSDTNTVKRDSPLLGCVLVARLSAKYMIHIIS